MNTIYAQQDLPDYIHNSIFLAGPTPRNKNVASWRPQAIEEFRKVGFTGTLLIPESQDGVFRGSYDDQVDWETEALQKSSCIMFWIPRSLPDMPGFTTNDEFGAWKASGKVVLGVPSEAVHTRYQWSYAEKNNIPRSKLLENTVLLAIDKSERLTYLNSLVVV